MSAIESAQRTLISRAQLNRPVGRAVYWSTLSVLIIVFALVFLFPLYWMATGGLKSAQEIVRSEEHTSELQSL